MLRILMIAGLVLSLAGCSERFGWVKRGVTFEGETFRGKARAIERSDKQVFAVTVSPASASLEGDIQAAEFRGIEHCIRYYGTSDISWEVGPDSDPATLSTEGDELTFRGRCRDL